MSTIYVNLRDATRDNRLLARAFAQAVTALDARTHSPPFLPDMPIQARMSLGTLDLLMGAPELYGYRGANRLFGVAVVVDPSVRDGLIEIVEPRSVTIERIEVR